MALPARTFSAASGLAARAAATICGELVASVDRGEALGLDDRNRVAALGDEAVEHLAGGADADALGGGEPGERGERLRA